LYAVIERTKNNSRKAWLGGVLIRVFTCIWIFISLLGASASFADEEEALTKAAMNRLAHMVDPGIPVALGKIVVRQAAIQRARAILSDLGRANGVAQWSDSPEWKAAEEQLLLDANRLVDEEINDPSWCFDILEREVASHMTAEEADYVANHFMTETGKEQWSILHIRIISEVMVFSYTFTRSGRIDPSVTGTEADFEELSKAYWKYEPFKNRKILGTRDAIKFAGEGAGLKFQKMMAIPVVQGFLKHIDQNSKRVEESVDKNASGLQTYIDAYLARTSS